MRALLLLQRLLQEFMEEVDVPHYLHDVTHLVHATVQEDNTRAPTLATEQCITSHTHHYHACWHFFWQAVRDSLVEVVYCKTTKQHANYMAMALAWDKFLANRAKMQVDGYEPEHSFKS